MHGNTAYLMIGVDAASLFAVLCFTWERCLMSQLEGQQPTINSEHTLRSFVQMILQAIYGIFTHHFRLDALPMVEDPTTQIEHQRRIGLLRLVIFSYLVISLLFAVVLPFLVQISPFLKWSVIVFIALILGCLALSYTRLTMLANVLFLLIPFGYGFALIYHEVNEVK